jgi:NitT/TauT family transport system ATP-binding protein
VRDAQTLRLMIRSEMPRKPVFAVVSPFSSHHALLRAWLRSAEINPNTDVRIAILPPPLVGEHMREGLIDGFCVGEPWNSVSALAGEGWIVATSASLAPLHPEKILLTSTSLMATDEYRLFRRALVQAGHWCDAQANRKALADLLHERTFPKLSKEALANSLVGPFHNGMEPQPLKEPLHCFYRHDANAATHQRATWFLEGALETGALQITPAQIRAGLSAFQIYEA